jgi:hypothetical protein
MKYIGKLIYPCDLSYILQQDLNVTLCYGFLPIDFSTRCVEQKKQRSVFVLAESNI